MADACRGPSQPARTLGRDARWRVGCQHAREPRRATGPIPSRVRGGRPGDRAPVRRAGPHPARHAVPLLRGGDRHDRPPARRSSPVPRQLGTLAPSRRRRRAGPVRGRRARSRGPARTRQEPHPDAMVELAERGIQPGRHRDLASRPRQLRGRHQRRRAAGGPRVAAPVLSAADSRAAKTPGTVSRRLHVAEHRRSGLPRISAFGRRGVVRGRAQHGRPRAVGPTRPARRGLRTLSSSRERPATQDARAELRLGAYEVYIGSVVRGARGSRSSRSSSAVPAPSIGHDGHPGSGPGGSPDDGSDSD